MCWEGPISWSWILLYVIFFFPNVFLFPLVLKIFKFLKRRDCF